jgi:hypothetical protein
VTASGWVGNDEAGRGSPALDIAKGRWTPQAQSQVGIEGDREEGRTITAALWTR